MISNDQKERVTRGFEQLGVERVERALAGRATTGPSWYHCFLAQAYGASGALLAVLPASAFTDEFADHMGVDRDCFRTISALHFGKYSRDALYALAAEWLEANRVAAPSAPVEAA